MRTGGLPKGWRVAQLGEICLEERVAIGSDNPTYAEMPYIGLEHIEPHTGKVLVSEQDARHSGSKSNNFRFNSEHVLYGKLRPYLNKVALPEFAGRCTMEIIPLKPVSVDRRWLAWLLRRQEVVDHAMYGKTGSQMPRTSMRDLLTLDVVVPPLPERRRIVKRLERQSRIAERIRYAATTQIMNIAIMPEVLFQSVLPGSPSEKLPPGWRWAMLGDVSEVRKGRTAKQAWYAEEGARLVRYRDLSESGINWTPGRHTFVDVAYESKLQRLHAGTILVGADAHDPATIGRKVTLVATIPHSVAPAYFAGEMLGIRPNKALVDPQIVSCWLRSHAGYQEIQHHVSGGHLNVRPARRIRIPIPPPDVQHHLVTTLARVSSAIERARTVARAQGRATDALLTALHEEAFER